MEERASDDGGASSAGTAGTAAGGSGGRGDAGGGGVGIGATAGGGAAGNGGAAAGSGGMLGIAGKQECGALIDDMEDGTGRICAGEGRVGVWYAYNDGLGVQWPPPTEPGTPILPVELEAFRGPSARAMYSFHSYVDLSTLDWSTGWGAGIGLDFRFDGKTYGAYDGSRYAGVRFFARSSRESTEVQLRVNTEDTTLVDYGGLCSKEFCNTYSQPFYVSTEWAEYRVTFAQMRPYLANPIVPSEPRIDRLTNLQFLFVRVPAYVDHDVWIDDVSFF